MNAADPFLADILIRLNWTTVIGYGEWALTIIIIGKFRNHIKRRGYHPVDAGTVHHPDVVVITPFLAKDIAICGPIIAEIEMRCSRTELVGQINKTVDTRGVLDIPVSIPEIVLKATGDGGVYGASGCGGSSGT